MRTYENDRRGRTRWYQLPAVVFLGLGLGAAGAWIAVTAFCALVDWACGVLPS